MRDMPSSYTDPVKPVKAAERTYTAFRPARPIRDWLAEGGVVPGHEANGTALTYDVTASLNRPGPPEFVVIGREDYDDGRWFLDFGISRAFIEATSDFPRP